MTRILYRPLGEGCAVKLRPIAFDESAPRILPVHGKPPWPHTAIAVDCEAPMSVGTLVELDVEFEASSRRFFGRGVVAWATQGTSEDKPARLGVVIYSLRPWSGDQIAQAPVAKSHKRPLPQDQSPAPQAALPTHRQEEAPAAVQHEKKDIALSATAAMLSPLQPLTGSPIIDDIAELLTNLLGEEVKVSRASTSLNTQDVCMLAEYTTEEGEATSVALADLRLANYLGAALAMFPAGAAETDVKAQKLAAEVRDNMKEIFNIATSLIAKSGGGHRKLGRVLELKLEQPTGALGALYRAPPFRYDFDVEVPGYGRGRLAYLSPAMQITDDDIAPASQAGAPPEPVAGAPSPIATTRDSDAAAQIPSEIELEKLLRSLMGIDFDLSMPGYGNGKFAALAARTKNSEATALEGSISPPAHDEAPTADAPAPEPAQGGDVLLLDPQVLGELLTGLVGEEVRVTVCSDPVPIQDIALVGIWQDDAGRDRLCFGFDLQIANFLGAALAMIPTDAAQDQIKAQHISDDVFANLNEICNIASGAINQEGSVLLKLSKLWRNDAELPAATSSALNGPDNRLDLEIELLGYGAGRLAIVVMT